VAARPRNTIASATSVTARATADENASARVDERQSPSHNASLGDDREADAQVRGVAADAHFLRRAKLRYTK